MPYEDTKITIIGIKRATPNSPNAFSSTTSSNTYSDDPKPRHPFPSLPNGKLVPPDDIYTFKSSEDYVTNKFLITAIIKEELDEKQNKCYEVNYRLINQSKQFISKKEVK
jgi:hypothetical protein